MAYTNNDNRQALCTILTPSNNISTHIRVFSTQHPIDQQLHSISRATCSINTQALRILCSQKTGIKQQIPMTTIDMPFIILQLCLWIVFYQTVFSCFFLSFQKVASDILLFSHVCLICLISFGFQLSLLSLQFLYLPLKFSKYFLSCEHLTLVVQSFL